MTSQLELLLNGAPPKKGAPSLVSGLYQKVWSSDKVLLHLTIHYSLADPGWGSCGPPLPTNMWELFKAKEFTVSANQGEFLLGDP